MIKVLKSIVPVAVGIGTAALMRSLFATDLWRSNPIYGIVLALLIVAGGIVLLVKQIRQDKDKAWWRRLGYVLAGYAAALIAAILLVWFS